jgi:hypothetical protein
VKTWRKKKSPGTFAPGLFINPGDNLLSRYSHYHRPQLLNGRVRNGNGCFQLGMVTGKSRGAVGGGRVGLAADNSQYQLVAISVALSVEPRGLVGAFPPADREKDQCGQAFGC